MFTTATNTKLFTKNKNIDIDIIDPNNPNPSPDLTQRNLSEQEKSDRLVGDLNGDGTVGMADFSRLLSSWGSHNPEADLNHDGTVNIYDFSLFVTQLNR